MNEWNRSISKARGYYLAFAAIVIVVDACGLGVWLAWGRFLDPELVPSVTLPFLMVPPVLSVFAAGILGASRLIRYPANNSSYFQWLATTPWQASSRIPFGPWYPVPRDIIPLSFLTLITMGHVWMYSKLGGILSIAPGLQELALNVTVLAMLCPALAFVVAWTSCGYFVRAAAHWTELAFTPLLTLGAMLHLSPVLPPILLLCGTVVLLVTAPILVWLRLKDQLKEISKYHLAINSLPAQKRKTSPTYDALSPHPPTTYALKLLQASRGRAVAIGVVLTVCLTLLPWERPIVLLLPPVAIFLGSLRVAMYNEKQQSHLGFLARWATGKYLVPEFDRVWITPICMALSGMTLAFLTFLKYLPPNVGATLSMTVPIVLGLTMGPAYDEWSLTAPSRYTRRRKPQTRHETSATSVRR